MQSNERPLALSVGELAAWWQCKALAGLVLNRLLLLGALGYGGHVDVELFVILATALLTMVAACNCTEESMH